VREREKEKERCTVLDSEQMKRKRVTHRECVCEGVCEKEGKKESERESVERGCVCVMESDN